VLRAPELDAGLLGGSQLSGSEGQNPLPRPADYIAFDAPRIQLAFWSVSANCQVMMSFSTTNHFVETFEKSESMKTVLKNAWFIGEGRQVKRMENISV